MAGMDAAVVWIVEAPPGGEDAATRRLAGAWARAHGAAMGGVVQSAETDVREPDPAIARGVEEELAHAHDALSALEIDAAERALSRAEELLRGHPELPQAAWLLAEVQRAWSARWLRGPAPDEARASRAWQRAASLDGGRAAGVGERSFAVAAPVVASLDVDATAARDSRVTLRIDGASVAAGPLSRGEGLHQLTVLRDGTPLWSGWITIARGTVVRVPVPPPVACSAEDLARARIDGAAVLASDVRCPRWTAIARGPTNAPGTIRIATCEDGRCDALVPWSPEGPSIAAASTPAHDASVSPAAHAHGWPGWATWTVVGAGAVVTAAIVLVASGALAAAPVETRFVNGGVRPASVVAGGGIAF